MATHADPLSAALETTLETARLTLEPLRRAHAPELFVALADPAIYRFVPQDPPADLAALEARCARLEARASPDQRARWLNWLVRERATGRCLGRLEATVEGDEAQLAYLFDPRAWGHGFACEGCLGVIAFLRDVLGVRGVLATIDTRNTRSIALAERLGLLRVSVRDRADFFKGAPSDEADYALRFAGHRDER